MPYFANADHAPVIFSSTFEITKRCNLRCLHCYRVEEPDRRELSTAEATDVLDQLRSLGCFSVYFTGGEVFSRDDFLDVVARARARGMNVTIASNANLVTEGIARELRRLSVMSVAISLYGSTGDVHDRMTKQPGSWDLTIQGARHLAAQGIATILRIVLTRFNQHQLDDMLALAGSIGAYHRLIPNLTPRTDGDRDPLALRADREVFERVQRMLGRGEKLPARGERPRPDARGVACGVAHATCTVNPYGDVLPCLILQLVAGNVRQESLDRIWTASPVFRTLRDLRAADFGACMSCDVVGRCNRCMGQAFMENGTIFEPAVKTGQCERARLRSDIHDDLAANGGVCPAHPPEGKI